MSFFLGFFLLCGIFLVSNFFNFPYQAFAVTHDHRLHMHFWMGWRLLASCLYVPVWIRFECHIGLQQVALTRPSKEVV